MIRVRGLKVWFSQRTGVLKQIMSREAKWVRAVDGVSFDVNRGEVYCLVGESGCGKTTTGKAILRLVEATEGDVLLEMPARDHAEYQKAKSRPGEPAAERRLEALRRRYSITWKENRPWSRTDYGLIALVMAAAFVLAFGLATVALGLARASYADQSVFVPASLIVGAVVGIFGALPPARPDRRLPMIAALVSAAALNMVPLAQGAIQPTVVTSLTTYDPAGTLFTAWGLDSFGIILGIVFSMAIGGGACRAIVSWRQQTEGLRGLKIRTLRRRLHLIFQDPYESLNPKQSVFEIVAEPLRVNHISNSPEEISSLVVRALEDTGLRPAEDFMFRFPHELSGGQRQRVSIAAGLVLEPDFIVADEPVSMLDVSIRTEILQLMMQLRKERNLTYLFITHDLGLAWILADHIAVMYLGKIVESGTPEQVIAHPKHPYTQALISVVPSPDPRKEVKRMILKGERPDAVDIPAGCRFHPRCPVAFEVCGWEASEVVAALQEAQAAIASQLTATIAERKARTEASAAPDVSNLEAAKAAAVGLQAAFSAADPRTVVVQPPAGTTAEDLAERLRGLVASQREQRLALKGIAEIRAEAGRVLMSLHAWSEPQLVDVAPGNQVACHLIGPAAATGAAPAAVPVAA